MEGLIYKDLLAVVKHYRTYFLMCLIFMAVSWVDPENLFYTLLPCILIGTILAECDVKSVFEKDVLYYAATKLVMLPAVLWVALRLSGIVLDEAAYMVLMILTAMPAGTTTAILAEGYGQDHIFASKAVFVTTVLSLVTVPLMAAII